MTLCADRFLECDFCLKRVNGESDDALGFVAIPVAGVQDASASGDRHLCQHCAKYVRSHFLSEAGVSAAVVLDQDDAAFESDTEW